MAAMDELIQAQPDPTSVPVSWWLEQSLRWRFVLLGCYLLLTIVWYYIFCSGADPLRAQLWGTRGAVSAVDFLLATLALFGAQFLFLFGAPHLRWPRPRRKRSIFVSLAIGAAIAALLSTGIFLAVWGLYRLMFDPASFKWQMHSSATTVPVPKSGASSTSAASFPWLFLSIVAAAWTLWFLVFALIGAEEWMGRFRRMYRILIAGTILELLITIPVDVEVRRRTDCYCGEGTLVSLAIGLTAIFWTFGPGIAILFLIRHRQIKHTGDRCLNCGYDLRGLNSSRCPECGRSFRRTRKRSEHGSFETSDPLRPSS